MAFVTDRDAQDSYNTLNYTKVSTTKNYVYQKKLLGHENAWDFLIVSGWNDRKNISSQYQ